MKESTETGKMMKTAKQLQDNGLVSFRGRNMNIGDAVSFDYSASGFEFIYEGKGSIQANFTLTGNEIFAVDVEGTVTYHSVGAGEATITLAENLAVGAHTIKVYKTQEAMSGLAQLNYLTYHESAVLKPIETDYNFLIIGASSTCGNQMDPDTGAENGYLAFPSLISRAYNASWQQISCSGRGVVQGTRGENGWVFSQDGMLAEMYACQSWFRDKSTKYDTSSFTPDVIITNFNNDFSGNTRAKGYDVDEVFERMMQFIAELRATYPNAYIAMTYGNYPTYETDGSYNNYDIIDGYIETVASYKSTSGDKKIDFITFPSLTGGASGHPSEEDHQYLAELVSAKVSQALDVENPLPLTRFEIESGQLVNAGDTGKVVRIENWENSVSKHSNNSYVEGMDMNLNGAAIAEDGSNVKYVSVPVTVPKEGTYKIEVNYGTDQTPVVYVRANKDGWKSLTLSSTGDWNKIGQNEEYTVYLSAGSNTIDITGGTNGSYVCLDRIDLIYQRN